MGACGYGGLLQWRVTGLLEELEAMGAGAVRLVVPE